MRCCCSSLRLQVTRCIFFFFFLIHDKVKVRTRRLRERVMCTSFVCKVYRFCRVPPLGGSVGMSLENLCLMTITAQIVTSNYSGASQVGTPPVRALALRYTRACCTDMSPLPYLTFDYGCVTVVFYVCVSLCLWQVLMSAMLSSQTKDPVTAAAVNRMRDVSNRQL